MTCASKCALLTGNRWQASDLGTVLAAPPGVFASRWCEGDIAVNLAKGEMDATLIYDPFQAAGAAMLASAKGATAPASVGPGSSVHVLEEMDTGCVLSIESTSPDHYARERSALSVKLFANLYCYNPEICSGSRVHCLNLVSWICIYSRSYYRTYMMLSVRFLVSATSYAY